MTHIITSLCLRDGGCIDVCPVDCIIPGKPESEWPWMYIDPDTCIDCGACIPECPFASGGEYISRVGLTGHYEATDHDGDPVVLDTTKQLEAGEVVDLTEDIQPNYDYFDGGPGDLTEDIQPNYDYFDGGPGYD